MDVLAPRLAQDRLAIPSRHLNQWASLDDLVGLIGLCPLLILVNMLAKPFNHNKFRAKVELA